MYDSPPPIKRHKIIERICADPSHNRIVLLYCVGGIFPVILGILMRADILSLMVTAYGACSCLSLGIAEFLPIGYKKLAVILRICVIILGIIGIFASLIGAVFLVL